MPIVTGSFPKALAPGLRPAVGPPSPSTFDQGHTATAPKIKKRKLAFGHTAKGLAFHKTAIEKR